MLKQEQNHNIFFVIPAYNEQEMISSVTEDLLSYGFSVVVVDDGSTPSLLPILSPRIHFLRHRINLGQGAALQTGIEYALNSNAEYIVTFDADGQHHAADAIAMLEMLRTNVIDVALGSRFLSGKHSSIPPSRRRLLRMARFINYLFTGLLLSDAHNGLRAFTQEAAKKIRFRENGMSHATEILSIIRKKQLRYTEVPVQISYTDYSKKKGQRSLNSFRILFDLLLNKLFR